MHARPALRGALIFAGGSLAYLLLSDLLLSGLGLDGDSVTWLQMAKGTAFILATATLLYIVWRKEERRLRRSHAVLERQAMQEQTLLEALPNVFYRLDGEGRVAGWNSWLLEVSGYRPEEIMGRPAVAFLAERDRAAALTRIAYTLETGEPHTLEAGLITADGRELPFEWHSARLPDGSGVLGIGVDLSRLKQTEERLRASLSGSMETLRQTVTAISTAFEKRDPYTAGHQHRVEELAVAIAGHMGLDADRQEGLYYAAQLHDIGKIAVPFDILAKPGRLSAEEYALVKTHALHGYEILRGIDFPWPVATIVRQHHERCDGSGYPDGLGESAILLESHILAVADVVEAMSNHRPYRAALGLQAALEHIVENRGRLYRADVVDACLAVLQEDGALTETAELLAIA